MELWSQVIVEWINCLDISKTTIKNIKGVQTHKCYEKLINLLPWKNEEISGNGDIVIKFIKDEYPEFELENKEEDRNDIYIGSLLLLYVSQEPVFHRPMCVKLQHDTQIKIKTFLEIILPYGKNITKEMLCEALAEVGGISPKTPCMTPRTQSLKEFLNTPASRSAQNHKRIFEHNRELLRLRAVLETERFEKSDLQLDLENQQKKIDSLQKKLEEKNSEMKLLREQQMKPATPQSCKKHKNLKHYEDLCRKEVNRLEEELLQQQFEMNKIQEEKESVSKRLASIERQHTMMKKKCVDFESSIESLLIQIEYRDKELIDLRMANEELHAHLESCKKSNVTDESCEFDNSLMLPSPRTGEVLSSVIDLQLQEAKIESDRLKAQLTSTTDKLRRMVAENERLTEANSMLQDNIREMTKYVEENVRLKEIAVQKNILEDDIIKLRDTVAAKDELLASLSEYVEENARLKEIAVQKNILEEDITKLRNTVAAKDELLASLSGYVEENARLKEIAVQKNILEEDIIKLRDTVAAKDELLASLPEYVEENARLKEIAVQKNILEEDIIKLRDTVAAKDELLASLSGYVEENARLKEIAVQKNILEEDIIKLRDTVAAKDELLASLPEYVEENARLKEIAVQKNILEEDIIKLRDTVAAKDELLASLPEYVEENARLKEIAVQKNILERDLATLQNAVTTKDELLSSFSASLEKFSVDVHLKLEDFSKKLNQSTERIKKVEDSKNDLRKNYESQITQMSSETQNLKLERDKILLDLRKINDSHEKLREEASNMDSNIKSKDETIESLTTEIKNLKNDCERLAFSLNKIEPLQSLKHILETQLSDKQCLLEQANNDAKLKEEAIMSLQSKVDELTKEKDDILKENMSMRDNASKTNKNELKLQSQVDTLSKEKKLLKEKLSVDRIRNVKLEKNIAELRNELKKVKTDVNSTSLLSDIEKLKQEVTCLKEENTKLSTKTENLIKQPEIENLRQEVVRLKEENTKLSKKTQNFSKQPDIENLRQEVAHLKEENTRLSKKTENLNKQPDIENLRQQVAELKEENILLSQKTESMIRQSNEEDVSNSLKHVHEKYEQKLEEIKQKMKVAYNEQVTKMNKMQSLVIQKKVESLKMQMEQQCQKHTDEISKYRAHVGELNKQFWNAAEKFLTEQQQKQEALQQLNELRDRFEGLHFDTASTQTTVCKQHQCPKPEKTDFTIFSEKSRSLKTTPEETCERRLSVRSIQTMGNAFKSADEEGEIFDNIYLADMKEGYCLPTHDIDRLSILQQRNSLFLPHLKSSYPAEMQFYPSGLSEEEIKTGLVTDDTFNDSLSQSLLPEQKPRRKDRTQTLYKRPGPPTPSKNGGRLSLQPGGHKSPASRILRERNSDRRTTTTPRGFRQMFNMRRQDENSMASPRRRISNIFRKSRATERPQKL